MSEKRGAAVGCELSVVIPAFNEEERLPSTLEKILAYFDRRSECLFEIIVVDDGSTDSTVEVVRQFSKRSSAVRLEKLPQNTGKGAAVRRGMLASRGTRIIYSDADGAADIEEIVRLEKALDAGCDVAIGSRAMKSEDTAISTVWYRKAMGRVFNGLVNMLIVPGIADTQCGFKLFSRSAAERLFSAQLSNGFSFDVEILFLCRRFQLKVTEVPINWTNVPGSKVDVVRDSIKMFVDIIRFRLWALQGKYSTRTPN